MDQFCAISEWTDKGMNATQGNPIQGKWEAGHKYYYKTILDDKGGGLSKQVKIQNFKQLLALGVGVPFEETSDGVRLVGGHTVNRVVCERIVGPVGRAAIISQLKNIQAVLLKAKWAHGDIKPQNIVVKYLKADLSDPHVYLIDCDYAQPFGKTRHVQTPAINGGGNICDEKTDARGFEFVYQMLK